MTTAEQYVSTRLFGVSEPVGGEIMQVVQRYFSVAGEVGAAAGAAGGVEPASGEEREVGEVRVGVEVQPAEPDRLKNCCADSVLAASAIE